MGLDTGAFKKYKFDNNKIIFEENYEEVEKENFKYPNSEFQYLADTIKYLDPGINLGQYLILELIGYDNPSDYAKRTLNLLENFNFEEALKEGELAKDYIIENLELVNKKYNYTHEPSEVLNYMLQIWKDKYYIVYNY